MDATVPRDLSSTLDGQDSMPPEASNCGSRDRPSVERSSSNSATSSAAGSADRLARGLVMLARPVLCAVLLLAAGCPLDSAGKGQTTGMPVEPIASGTSSASASTGGTSPVGSDSADGHDGSGPTSTTGPSGSSTGEPEDDALRAYFGTFAASASEGIESVTGVGFEPRAVLLWVTEHQAGGWIQGARFGRGWSDGEHQGAVATAWGDGSNATQSLWSQEHCVVLVDEQGAVLAAAAVASFDPDGFSLQWSTPGAGRRVAFLALGGPIQARVGNLSLSLPTEVVDTVGFSAQVVLFAGVTVASAGSDPNGGHGFGVAVPDGSTHSSAHYERNNGNGTSGLAEGVAMITAAEAPPPVESYTLSGVDSRGFALERETGSGAIGTTWLAIGGVSASAGVITQPGVAGPQSVPLGFEPAVVMFDGGDKVEEWAEEPELVHGVAVGVGSQGAAWIGREGDMTRSAWDLQRALVSFDAGEFMPRAEATIAMVGPAGFSIDWSAVDDVERRIGWLALGSGPPD
ncbi:MAG: hypothetical protein AAGF11_35805 [Myxococcota bacterium]